MQYPPHTLHQQRTKPSSAQERTPCRPRNQSRAVTAEPVAKKVKPNEVAPETASAAVVTPTAASNAVAPAAQTSEPVPQASDSTPVQAPANDIVPQAAEAATVPEADNVVPTQIESAVSQETMEVLDVEPPQAQTQIESAVSQEGDGIAGCRAAAVATCRARQSVACAARFIEAFYGFPSSLGFQRAGRPDHIATYGRTRA